MLNKRKPQARSLTWINFNPSMDNYTSNMNCRMKVVFHSKISTATQMASDTENEKGIYVDCDLSQDHV